MRFLLPRAELLPVTFFMKRSYLLPRENFKLSYLPNQGCWHLHIHIHSTHKTNTRFHQGECCECGPYLWRLIRPRPYGAPFVSEVRESGPWWTSVTGRRDGLLKQTARIPGADCFRSLSERAVGAGRGRTATTGHRHGLLKQTAQIPGADCCRSWSFENCRGTLMKLT